MKSALLLAILAMLATRQVAEAKPEDTRTLTGEFVWTDGGADGDLEAVFTPAGERKWDVDFHFTFGGQSHVYSGIAEGSLTEGELKGTVHNEDKGRRFIFAGTFKDGKFRGTHSETTGGEKQSTGTLTLGAG